MKLSAELEKASAQRFDAGSSFIIPAANGTGMAGTETTEKIDFCVIITEHAAPLALKVNKHEKPNNTTITIN